MKRLEYLGIAGVTVVIIWLLQGVLALQPGTASEPALQPEIRGVWLTNVDSQVFFSPENLQETVENLSEANFNTVYPAVWSWGYTLYPSAVGKRATGYAQGLYPDLEDEGRNEALERSQADRDVLQEVIELSHPRHLDVIPWFEFGFMAPANVPLVQRHPDWLTQQQGELPEARLYQEGRHTRVWLNPFHPQVQGFILELIEEIVSNYPVDGLQLDDHFGLPVEFGYDPYTVALYQQEHGGQSPPSDPRAEEWMRWRADKITEFMDQVFRILKVHRPRSVLSVAPNSADFAYRHYLQDWSRWRQMGYVEELIVQAYRDSIPSFQQVLTESAVQAARTHIPTGVGILSGLKHRLVPMDLIGQQVEAARTMQFAGVSFFFYDTLWNGDEERHRQIRRLFTTPQPRPPLAQARRNQPLG